jgi:hypothetical protein
MSAPVDLSQSFLADSASLITCLGILDYRCCYHGHGTLTLARSYFNILKLRFHLTGLSKSVVAVDRLIHDRSSLVLGVSTLSKNEADDRSTEYLMSLLIAINQLMDNVSGTRRADQMQ